MKDPFSSGGCLATPTAQSRIDGGNDEMGTLAGGEESATSQVLNLKLRQNIPIPFAIGNTLDIVWGKGLKSKSSEVSKPVFKLSFLVSVFSLSYKTHRNDFIFIS
jgi:hypothetical protein